MDLAVMKETGRGFSGRCANQYLRPSVLATVSFSWYRTSIREVVQVFQGHLGVQSQKALSEKCSLSLQGEFAVGSSVLCQASFDNTQRTSPPRLHLGRLQHLSSVANMLI